MPYLHTHARSYCNCDDRFNSNLAVTNVTLTSNRLQFTISASTPTPLPAQCTQDLNKVEMNTCEQEGGCQPRQLFCNRIAHPIPSAIAVAAQIGTGYEHFAAHRHAHRNPQAPCHSYVVLPLPCAVTYCRDSKISVTMNGMALRPPTFDNQGQGVLIPGVQVCKEALRAAA